jgi:hypothetical protein
VAGAMTPPWVCEGVLCRANHKLPPRICETVDTLRSDGIR